MYYLIEYKDNSIKIIDNITDLKTRDSAVYKYCLENNIYSKQSIDDIHLSGRYCVPTVADKYAIYDVEPNGYILKGKRTLLYSLKFVHYIVHSGNKCEVNEDLKSYMCIMDIKV